MKILNLKAKEINQNDYHYNKLTANEIGILYITPLNIIPENCLSCDGYILKIGDYRKLYEVIGSYFNQGSEADDEFRIPDYNITKRFLQPGVDAGTLVEAGLPDHRHDAYRGFNSRVQLGNDNGVSYGSTGGSSWTSYASANNSIYGKSTTVQPPSQIVHVCIRYK